MRAPKAASSVEAPAPNDGKHKGKEGEKVPLYKIDNIIVNPAGSQGARFLMVSLAIEAPDARALDRLREREAQVRDVVTSVLERQTLEMLTRLGARERMKSELISAVAPIAGVRALDIYLPQFVIQ
jgi:flagellar FliL protein